MPWASGIGEGKEFELKEPAELSGVYAADRQSTYGFGMTTLFGGPNKTNGLLPQPSSPAALRWDRRPI